MVTDVHPLRSTTPAPDIALRDGGLPVGAVALARLAVTYRPARRHSA